MSQLMTFQEVLNNGYRFPVGIDTATKELIKEWFQFREVASNTKFTAWFNRALTLNYPYYRQLMRIDPTVSDFDWLIENYIERQNTSQHENINNNTQNVTGTMNTTGSSSIDTNTSQISENEGNTKNRNEGYTRETGLQRVAPMSQEYTGTQMEIRDNETIAVDGETMNAGALNHPYVNISNPTGTSDNHGKHGDLSSTTDTQRGETTGTGHTGTSDSHTQSNNQHTTNENSNSGSALVQEIVSGRNVPISQLLDSARIYIAGSKAWDYLYKQLDKCFMQVYESEVE